MAKVEAMEDVLLAITDELDGPPDITIRDRIEHARHQFQQPNSNRKKPLLRTSTSTSSENRIFRYSVAAHSVRASARLRLRTLLFGATMMAFSVPTVSAQQATFPSGASSLQETYQDWQLNCVIREDDRACTLLQDQAQQNGQRLLAVEISLSPEGAVATLLLPFGILFDSGVTPQIDDQAPLQPVRFRTCLPTGCIAHLPVDEATLDKLQAGTSLKLTVTTAANTSLTFPVSLKGLTAALDRLNAVNGS